MVSKELAGQVAFALPQVKEGMGISSALDLVFAAQQVLFSPAEPFGRAGSQATTRLDREPVSLFSIALSRTEAEGLTARIKEGLGNLPLLILEAHEGRAWRALGYRTWEAYVRNELKLSRSRSYEILDQARVLRAISQAAGSGEIPYISGLAALQIKPRLEAVVAEVRSALARSGSHATTQEVATVVLSAVGRARVRIVPSTGAASIFQREPTCGPLLRLLMAIDSQPSPRQLVAELTDGEIERLGDLQPAAKWFDEFFSAWIERTQRCAPGSTVRKSGQA